MKGFDRILKIGSGDDQITRGCRIVRSSRALENNDLGTVSDVDISLELHWERAFIKDGMIGKEVMLNDDATKYDVVTVRDPNGLRRKLIFDLMAKEGL